MTPAFESLSPENAFMRTEASYLTVLTFLLIIHREITKSSLPVLDYSVVSGLGNPKYLLAYWFDFEAE